MPYLMLKYVGALIAKVILILFTYIPAALIVPLFYKDAKPNSEGRYTWGWIWGTYDNPPRGDRRWFESACPYPFVTDGFKGYYNRVRWLIRNPLYGFARKVGVLAYEDDNIILEGNEDISDKHNNPGKLISRCYDRKGKLKGAEIYIVKPWIKPFQNKRCLRVRLGWKVKSRSALERGFYQFVFTINPFDGLGDD